MLIIELNSFMKSSGVQPGHGIATIISKTSGRGVGIDEACGQERKKNERLFLDRWSAAIFLEPTICSQTIFMS